MILKPYQKRCWAQIDLDAAAENFATVKKAAGESQVCCVVKANAYGHGAIRLSKLYESLGAGFLAVSNIEEALQLRDAGTSLPILILGYTDPECAAVLCGSDITQCVFSIDYARRLSSCAAAAGAVVKVHIKLDTGMGRIGFECRDGRFASEEVLSVFCLPAIQITGIFTHFASADEGNGGKDYTMCQFYSFTHAVDTLVRHGADPGIRHCANSAAIFDYPQTRLDMVRAGIVLYGLAPSDKMNNLPHIKPCLELFSIIDHVKTVRKNEPVSYGRDFVALQDMKVATIPVGYADGLWRSNYRNGLSVSVGDGRAPVIGRICMDQCMIDISGIDGAGVGSVVKLYAAHGPNSLDSLAKANSTINYEIACAVGHRVPRVYMHAGREESVSGLLEI